MAYITLTIYQKVRSNCNKNDFFILENKQKRGLNFKKDYHGVRKMQIFIFTKLGTVNCSHLNS